jgi:hypothetical protein
VLADGRLQVDQRGEVEGVGVVVGEGAVELEVERHDLQRQRRETGGLLQDRGDRQPAHAVAGVHHHPQRPAGVQRDERTQVGGVPRQRVVVADRPALGVGSGRRAP